MGRRALSWFLLVASTAGLAVTMVLWLENAISNRAMLGVTLALSWLALMYEAFNAVQISHDAHKQNDS